MSFFCLVYFFSFFCVVVLAFFMSVFGPLLHFCLLFLPVLFLISSVVLYVDFVFIVGILSFSVCVQVVDPSPCGWNAFTV